jgi:hypothetical protein
MGPNFAANVTSAIRSMEQTVIPAVDPKNGLAQEQAYLVLYYLRLFVDQHRHLLDFRLQEIRDYHALTQALLDKAEKKGIDLGEVREAASQALASGARYVSARLPSYDDLADAAQSLREAADQLTTRLLDGGGGALMKDLDADRLILATSARDELRDRAWVKGLGLDPSPDQIPPLSELLRT